MDISQMNRSGKIASAINSQKLKTADGTLIPFLFFDIQSKVDLGSEVLEERAKVLLQGDELCEAFQNGSPKEGDEIILLGVTAYVRNGLLCLRPTSPEQFKHISQSAGALSGETFGLSREDFVNAAQIFKK